MSSEMGAKYIYCNIAQEHKLHNAIIVTLEGTEIIKTEKKKRTTKQSEEHIFHQCCETMATITEIASQFQLIIYIR